MPFVGKDYAMPRLRMHSLPWPTDVLDDICNSKVTLRITLSYFIEPSPAKRGWRQRYSYASHGLRFELQGPSESERQLLARINRDNLEANAEAADWLVGPRQRDSGSLHQDEWTTTGHKLANCHTIVVYPVGGWWKKNARKDRMDLPVRYSLLVSLRTEEEGVDLYTPIATQIVTPVPVEIAGQ